MTPTFKRAMPGLPKLAWFVAAFALLALVALPVVSQGTAEAGSKAKLSFDKTTLSGDEDSLVDLTVKLNKVQDDNVSFWVVTKEGTATEDDYIGGRFPVTIHAGHKSLTMPVLLRSDQVEDDSETFTVSIEVHEDSESIARVVGGDATITIREIPPDPVQNLTLTVDGTSVKATWDAAEVVTPVHPSQPVPTVAEKYVARIHVASDVADGKSKKGIKRTRATFSNLEAGETYTVWVRGVNKFGHKGERAYASITIPE